MTDVTLCKRDAAWAILASGGNVRGIVHVISGPGTAWPAPLAYLLRENPRVHAGVPCPLAGMVGALLGEMCNHDEFALFARNTQHDLRGLFADIIGDPTFQQVSPTSITTRLQLTTVPRTRGLQCRARGNAAAEARKAMFHRTCSSVLSTTLSGAMRKRYQRD